MKYLQSIKTLARCAAFLLALAAMPAPAQVLARADYEAPVTVVVYSAFACPFCQQARSQLDALAAKHGGRVRVVFKHFPLGHGASDFLAHEVALAAAAQGRFKAVHDALFTLGASALGDRAKVLAAAAAAGADARLIEQELDAGKWREKVEDDIAEARAYRVVATPTFYLDGFKLEGLQGNGTLEQLVDFRLAQASAERKPNVLDRLLGAGGPAGSVPRLSNAVLQQGGAAK